MIRILILSIALSLSVPVMSSDIPSVKQRLHERQNNRCYENLERYKREVKRHPNSPYYKFMFKKWQKKCR